MKHQHRFRSAAVVPALAFIALICAVITATAGLAGQPVPSSSGMPATQLPVYHPPMRGAPSRRVSGGARGPDFELPMLAALAPEHTGLTTRQQPGIYWYLSAPADTRLEFTLNQDGRFEPLVETRLKPPATAGIQRVNLADYGVRLESGNIYQWFIALVPDAEQRSQDLLAGGALQRITPDPDLQRKLADATPTERVFVYAEAGIWYDAVDALSGLIASDPKNASWRQQRAALMDQVGLPEVAAYDRGQIP